MNSQLKSSTCPKCGSTVVVSGNHPICPQCALTEALVLDTRDPAARSLSLGDIPAPKHPAGVIGDYELLEVIAQGGMGVIYKARQRSLNRVVALKLLLGGAHAGADFKRRFQQEAETVAKLKHPNIVPVYEIGEHERQPYFSMEYVAGQDFSQLTRRQPLSARKAANYLGIVAEAMDYAHQQGVLHRDLKPSNLLLGIDDRPRITDFGLARQLDVDSSLTMSGVVLGTPGYLPPEQASATHGQVGVCSDVYALGAVLYHLLTGRPPFVAGSVAETLRQVLETEPLSPRRLNPEVPRDLETICLKCLAKTPVDRYASATELARELGSWLDHKPIQARSASVRMRRAKHNLRQRLVAVPLAVILLLATTSACLLWTARHRQQSNRGGLVPHAASATNYNAEQKLEVVISGRSGNQDQPGQFDPNPSLKSFYSPDPSVVYDFSAASSGAVGPVTKPQAHWSRRREHAGTRPEAETAAPK